jgi:NADPH:quinone reductase-like Zn-dependent oxidoreductase
MKAFVLPAFDAAPELRELDDPVPGDGELLVRVQASSANPVDNAIVAGYLKSMAEHRFPVTLGRDFAGVVEHGAGSFSEGDAVYGLVPHAGPDVHAGAWGDRIVVPADGFVAAMPDGVGMAEAGAAALAGVTALLLVEGVAPSAGERVAVVGANGGVGAFAVQLAARAGATVIAVAAAEDEDFVLGLGAAELVARGSSLPSGIDALIDTATTGEDFAANAAALRPGGRASSPLGAAGEGPGRTNVMAVSSTDNLRRLTGLLPDLRVPIQRTYDLADAGAALADLASAHTRGKRAVRLG